MIYLEACCRNTLTESGSDKSTDQNMVEAYPHFEDEQLVIKVSAIMFYFSIKRRPPSLKLDASNAD